MTTTKRSLLLGSILLSAIGFAACSDDSTDDNGAGGTGTGGKSTGTGGAARGGISGVGGVARGGAAGSGMANGGAATGGIGNGGTAGAPGTGGAVAGAAGARAAASGAAAGVAGTATASGGATAGAAGTATASGGATAGAAGTVPATGGAGSAGAPGNGGAAAGSAGAGTAGAAGAAFAKVWAFDALDGWSIKASTGEVPRIDVNAGTTLTTGLTPGIATWTVPFVAAANTSVTQTALENNFTAVDMTGKTITLKMRWVSGGVGVAAAATGGFDVHIVASDADLTEGSSSLVGALALADRGAAAFKSFTYTVPGAAAPWAPAAVRQLNIRLDSRYWTADPQPVFDYTTAVFEIDSVTY